MSTSNLEREIHEQPAIIRQLLERETDNIHHLAAELRGRFDYVIIAARGTSDNAARYANYLLGAWNGLPVALAAPSLYTLYHCPPRMGRALVVGISQSGQSPDIVAVVRAGREQGQSTLAITNDPASPLAEAAASVIPIGAGREQAVAATKTYTASLAALALFSAALAEDTGRLEAVERLPEIMQATLSAHQATMERVERYRYMDHCAVIGRGYNYATAFETALKIKELTRIYAEAYSSADFRHGPIALSQPGFPHFIIAPSGAVHDDITNLVANLMERRSELLIASDDERLLSQANLALPLPHDLPEWLTPLVAILPGQLFALRLTQVKGYDPDKPAGLQKVTETW